MSDILGGDDNDTRPAQADEGQGRAHIKVNGMTIEVVEKVTIREVLAKAKGAGAIEGEVDEYVIERIDREGELGLEEVVVVTDQEEFLAVPTGKTDVA